MAGSGQPGSGDALFRYLSDNQYNSDRVRRRELTPNADRGYEEFPEENGLTGFDPADRIYVALAAGQAGTCIANCVDSDYRNVADALIQARVRVRELCPDCL